MTLRLRIIKFTKRALLSRVRLEPRLALDHGQKVPPQVTPRSKVKVHGALAQREPGEPVQQRGFSVAGSQAPRGPATTVTAAFILRVAAYKRRRRQEP